MPLLTMYRSVLISAVVLLFPVLMNSSATAATQSFTDIQGHWAESSIERLAQEHLLEGVTKDRFEPNRFVTYEEWYVLMDRVTQYQPIAPSPHLFLEQSLPANHWAYASVNRMANVGVFHGLQLGKAIPRAEVAETAARFLALDEVRQAYMDVSASRYRDVIKEPNEGYQQAFTAIQVVNDYGILEGFPDGTFQPHAPLTRAQAAIVLERLRDQHNQTLKASTQDELLKHDITEALTAIVRTSQETHGQIGYQELKARLQTKATPAFLDAMVKWYHEMNLEGTDAAIMIPTGAIAREGKGIYIVTPLHMADNKELYKIFIREDWGELHGFVSLECYVGREAQGIKVYNQQDVYQELLK